MTMEYTLREEFEEVCIVVVVLVKIYSVEDFGLRSIRFRV
jgi:hypothetical protein